MKNKTYLLNILLAGVLGIALLIAVAVRTFAPNVIIPALDIPNLTLISLVALVLDYYLAPKAKRCYLCMALYALLTFGLFPWAAAFVAPMQAVKLALVGMVVFLATAWMFTSIRDRLSSGPKARAAAVVSAFGIYLAVQGFATMLL